MKKYLIPFIILVVISLSSAAYFFLNNSNKKNLTTRPLYINHLKEKIIAQNISIADACKNPDLINKKLVEITDASFEDRFVHLCEDHTISNELKEHFNSNSDYKYFLECARNYAAEMQQLMKDLKEHYPEDYKNLNFNHEDVLLKYLKHPDSAYFQAQCESKSEALYWKSLSQSNKVEDLQFCIQVTKDCVSGLTKKEECPADFKTHLEACSKKLNSMKSH